MSRELEQRLASKSVEELDGICKHILRWTYRPDVYFTSLDSPEVQVTRGRKFVKRMFIYELADSYRMQKEMDRDFGDKS